MDEEIAKKELRVLMLEDTPSDAELAEHELRKAGIAYVLKRVETRDAFIQALEEFHPDILLSDYKLPDFDGMAALKIVQRDHPEVPVVMVTGALSDIEAVELIHAGARDYVLKDRLARLAPAVQRALSAEQGARARKAAEKALHESEAKFRALVESTSDWIWEVNEQAVYTYTSPQVYELLGYSAGEIIGKTPFDLMPPVEAVRMMAVFNSLLAGRKPIRLLESANLHKDGRLVFLETSGVPMFDAQGVFRGYRGIDRDITERKLVEQALQESLIRYTTVTESANDAMVCLHPDGSIELWNKAAQRMFGYSAVEAIGKALHQLIIPERYRSQADEGMRQFGLTGTGAVVGKMLEMVALRRDGTEFPVELSISAMNFGGAWHATGIIRDITERKETERERIESADRLEQTLLQTIEAIAATVEARDPYTAGHQRRAAILARAIAHEMALPEDKIRGLYLAATIHDLGKISIPAEILSKPGILNPVEYELVKTHPQTGYDIIKDVQFPWPIAQIVLQHHERLDGTGYPQHLKGEQIQIEAKILAVADVVEAMSSHRPYRPGMGLEAALEEIARQRGVLYEPAVVDCCITLFREKQFNLDFK